MFIFKIHQHSVLQLFSVCIESSDSPPPKQYTLFCTASIIHVCLFLLFVCACMCACMRELPSCWLACVCEEEKNGEKILLDPFFSFSL